MALLDTIALILKSTDTGETSRRLTVVSGEEGRLSLTVRGARSSRGGAVSGLEPYMVARLFASIRDDADLGTLTRAEVLASHGAVRESLIKMAAAGVLCEVLDRGVHPRMACPGAFRYGCAFLETLNNESEDKALFLLGHALLRTAQALGLAPRVDRCVLCGRSEPGQWLDYEAGGLVCGGCIGRASGHGVGADRRLLALVAACAQRPWAQMREALDHSPEALALVDVLVRWLGWRLECRFASVRFLESVCGMSGEGLG